MNGSRPRHIASVRRLKTSAITTIKGRAMNEEYIATTAQIAEILGVSGRLVRSLSSQGVLPKIGRNEFDLREAIPAFYARKTGDEEGLSAYERERTRYMKVKADQAELEFGIRAKKYGNIDDIREVFGDQIIKIRSQLLSHLPRQLALAGLPKDARTREIAFKAACEKVLRALGTDNIESLERDYYEDTES